MKFFSLISNKEVRIAPGTKKIPAAEFSTIQSAAEVLETVLKEAIDFKKEVTIEVEKTKEAAFAEGFQAGLTSLNEHLLALDEELKELRVEIQ